MGLTLCPGDSQTGSLLSWNSHHLGEKLAIRTKLMSKLNNIQKCEIIRKQCISDWWQEQEKGTNLASSRDRKEASVAEAQ